MFVIGQHTPSGIGYFSGTIYLLRAFGSSTPIKLLMPPSTSVYNKLFSGARYRNRYYMVGGHSANTLVDEHFRVLRQGMIPPTSPPSLAVGGGAVSQIGYLSFWDEKTAERSSLSAGTTVTGNTTRTWTNLPIVPPNDVLRFEFPVTITLGVVTVTGGVGNLNFARPGDHVTHSLLTTKSFMIRSVDSSTQMTLDDTSITLGSGTLTYRSVPRPTHVELWVAVAGALPRLAQRVRIGTTTAVEAVPTLSLGEAFLTNFEPFPPVAFNAIYADRQIGAGHERERDTLFLSPLFFPERWDGLSFKTRNGDPIVGLVGTRDYALAYTNSSAYILKGYTENDLTFEMVDPEVGAISHFMIAKQGDTPWVVDKRGSHLFNGTHHNIMLDRRTEWIKQYLLQKTSYDQGFAVHNPGDFTFQFWPTTQGGSGTAHLEAYIAGYQNMGFTDTGAALQPDWTNDDLSATLQVKCGAYLSNPDSGIGALYYGDDAGNVWMESTDETLNTQGQMVIRTKHYNMGMPGGDETEGKTLVRFWSYLVSEYAEWTVTLFPGDEYAREAVYPLGWGGGGGSAGTATPVWKDDQLASFLTGTIGADFVVWAAKVVHVHVPEDVVGRGFVWEYTWDAPSRVRWIGFGGQVGPGPAFRGLVQLDSGG